MTDTFVSEKQLLLWILSLLLFTAAEEDGPCPKGGQVHLSSVRCYWMPETTSSWSEAQLSCRETSGGDLASAESLELQNFIHFSFPAETTVWVWLKRRGGEGSEDESLRPSWRAQGQESGCTQMSMGTLGQWRRAPCAGRHFYLCEKDITEALPPVDSYLTGLILMTGIYAQTQIHPLLSVPDIGQRTVEMQLFPGLWFSHAGQLVKVKLVVQPSPLSSLARVQILRPYCDPNHHLIPPGCSSLLNPFSCCSPVPLCNTTGGCRTGQYWCHLLEACVPITSPCSPYDSITSRRGFALPPRYPAIPPFYHLVADLSLRLNPSSELETMNVHLPDTAIMVYPDDVIAIQHTRDPGAFLHCLNSQASLNSSWRQSYLSLQGAEWGGWWQGGLTSLSRRGQWVDGVVCDLSILYIDALHRGTELEGIFGFTHTEETTAPHIKALATASPPDLRSKFKLQVIHPLLDQNNQIHVQINIPTLIVVKVLSGQNGKSSWSFPVLQTGLPFLPSCPEDLARWWPGCKKQSLDEWFSSVTLWLPSVGVQTLNISVVDGMSPQSVQNLSVTVCGYETVTGLRVEPRGCLRMLVDTSRLFTAKVESGSSVKFTWVIDNMDKFAFEGESYSVAFKKPAEYKLLVTASNPVSSQSQEIILIADEVTPLSVAKLLFVQEVIAVNTTHLYTIRVKVDISLPVTFRWDFGDGSRTVSHSHSAPCQNMEGLVERGERQVYVQDSVNYTYPNPGDFTLHVQVSNQYDKTGTSTKITVHPVLSHIHISCTPAVALVNHTLLLEASAEPSTHAVFYTWDFGDGSTSVQGTHHKVHHTFESARLHNITVSANNTVSLLTTWLILEVMEKISGLTISYSEPSEVNSAIDFRAKVATGTSLTWDFDFGDGFLQRNHTDGSISHIYKSPGNYTVVVTVSNSVSKSHQSIEVEVYIVAVSGVLPTECIINGKDIKLTALVTGRISSLIFHWEFGDGSPLTVVTRQSTAIHSFPNPGIFHVSVTVFSSVTSVSFNTTICVETPITNTSVQASQVAAAVGDEVCFTVFVSPEQVTGYQFTWFSNSFTFFAKAKNSQECFVFKKEGVEEVSVLVSNKVSNKTAKGSITIQEPVTKLSVMHDSQSNTLTVNTLVSFWATGYSGSNVSMLWDFGDGSPVEHKKQVSHVFTSTGHFTVTATGSNLVSRASATIKVNVLLPVVDLSLHVNQSYAAVGEEILITAVSSAINNTDYYWIVEGLTSNIQGTYQFKFIFPRPGVYHVRVTVQNLVSRRESATLIEVFERIEGLQIDCHSLTNMEYLPAKEEQLFIASVTKGSNVTYHWLVIQSGITQEIIGHNEYFHLLVETPGNISVQVRASNMLGEATSTLSAVTVERVSCAGVSTGSNIVALGKLVNISVSVVTGSDLEYLWYVNFDSSPLKTDEPFLIYNFTSLGDCLVRVIVQNVLGKCNGTKQFVVQEEIQEVEFEIEGNMHPFYINTSAAVSLHGFVGKGSDLHWSWEVRDAKNHLLNATNQIFMYTFTHVDIYQVSLNVSNVLNWQMVSHSVTVQDAITGLTLNISKMSFCSEEEATFVPSVSRGSNVSFLITFRNNDWIQSQSIEGQYNTSSLPAGRYQVTVKAWNLVSSAEVSSSILVREHIYGLRLVNCCSTVLEVLKGINFKAQVQSGFPVDYTWIFYMVGLKPVWLMGQEVSFTPPESGSLSVSVVASNGGCSLVLNETTFVELPIKDIKVLCHSEKIFAGYTVQISATVIGGSNIRYMWDFGDSSEALVTDFSAVNHTYYVAGKYNITVKVHNNVSHMSKQLHLEVEALQCSSLQASLVQSQSTIYRSRMSLFEARVDVNCATYKIVYLWEIFQGSDCTSRKGIILPNHVDTASPVLFLPKHTLDVGQYCLGFTVSLQGTPVTVKRTSTFTVVHSPLVAVIKGGSHKLWSSLSDLILDGSESQDPDVGLGGEDMLEFHWTFVNMNSTESHFVENPFGSNNSRITVLSNQLLPGTVYIFSLSVHKAGRKPASTNQTVIVGEGPVLPVTVKCVSCSALSSSHQVSDSTAVILAGQCGQCDDQAQYEWSAEVQTGVTLYLDDITTSTGRHSPNLVVRSGVLQPGQSYTFTLNVSQPGRGQWGSASQTILPKNPPHGGLCDLSPESDIHLLETVVTYNCSGWQDDESEASQLIYTFQVAPCQPVTPSCPMLTLYRGTRSTFGSLLPMGRSGQQKNVSVITVTILVEDHLGSKTIALNRSLTVENPARDGTVNQWLRNKSQTVLRALIQHGNPQEIIPYSVALTGQLNHMDSEWTASQLMDRREIRRAVSEALASLRVSSLLDVDQISSALAQSTAVPQELVCWNCQKKVLESVGNMIHVMEEQMSPGVSVVLETGRNILNIIGNTLAAVSESTSASSSHPVHSSPSLSASTIALSAFAHAGALVRSMMHSRVHGEEPLLLSTPYLNTVSFQGDPTDLLCSHKENQSNQHHSITSTHPCQFHIPSSLTAHLKSQSSEVVQVLFGMDGAKGSNAMLSGADPPISTALVAMELTTPQGQLIPISDLDPEQAIQVTLPNKYLVRQEDDGADERASENTNETCLTATLPTQGQLNFSVKAVDGLDENAGLFISFNFSLVPGATSMSLGHVKIEVSSAVPGTNASQDSLEREWILTLSAPSNSSEQSVFLSPLLQEKDIKPLFITMTSSLPSGGPVLVSVCVFSSLCQYYSVEEKQWSSEGLKPLEGSTLQEAHCLTQHLTIFGASLFVHLGAAILLPPSEGPIRNILVGIVCAVLVLTHLLVGLIAHKLDHLDSLRLSQVPLCGRPGLYHYRVLVKTGWRRGAGTTAHVGISLYGVNKSGSRHLQRDGAFQRGSLDLFHLETDENLGEVWKIRIWHDNTGLDPSWYIQHVVVWDTQTDHMFFFVLEDWLSVENQKNETVEKEVLASCPEELTQFRRVLTSQLMFGLTERHLWLSLWTRPAHSSFTRGQRVTCSALMLHLYLALGALWYGAVGCEGIREITHHWQRFISVTLKVLWGLTGGPVSAKLLVNMETVAMGMTVAVLVYPLQCFLCFLFRKAHSQVTVDMSVPPSPVCHSVEMDVYLGQSDISSSSLLSLPYSSSLVRESPSSLLESKVFDSSILDFWAASGLAPQTQKACQDKDVGTWPSCDSLLSLPVDSCPTKMNPAHNPSNDLLTLGRTRQLRRKKALMQLRLASPSSPTIPDCQYSSTAPEEEVLTINTNPTKTPKNNLKTFLTLSEEDLLMSIAAAEEATHTNNSNSDSGRGSPRTTSPFSAIQSMSCSSCSGHSEYKNPQSSSSLYGTGLYKCPSVVSLDSVASTFLPSPSPDSTCSCSTTRIGVSRGQPSWLLPPWALRVMYPLVAVLLGVCLAVVGLYGSFFSRTVVLMWLVSALCAFLTSALLLEPLKVCVQALIYTVLWRPVDPEVEEQLAQETTVVRVFGEHSAKVRPPCGYGLLQAKDEARKVRALQSLMRQCVCQLLFLLLVLMVNYQDSFEQKQGRLLHSTVRRQLHTAPMGVPNLTSIRDGSDAEQWINHTLIPHLHQNPPLRLVGSPRLQFTHTLGHVSGVFLGNSSVMTHQLLSDLRVTDWNRKTLFKSVAIDFTQYHRESGLFVCVSIQLEWAHKHRVTPLLSIHPLLIPSSFSGLDFRVAITVLLLISALLILFGELWSMASERAQYLNQCKHWFQLILVLLSLATAVLQFCFLSVASRCFSKLQSQPDSFINFHSAAALAQRSSQCAAVLLTLLVLKLLGSFRFVRRWLVIDRVLQRARGELWALTILLLLLLTICTHLGNMLFSHSVEGFLSVREAGMSVLSILRGQIVLQRLCKVHTVLGPLYGLLLMMGGLWLLAKLCGAVLIQAYRAEQAELYQPTIEPQNYEMVEFFIKRFKLWMGLTKAKQFRHKVKFEGMDIPPSRFSQESRLSTLSSTLPSYRSPSLSSPISSPCPLSSVTSVRSEDSSVSEPEFDVLPYLDHLVHSVTALLSCFDRVNQITEDVHNLEIKLEEAHTRRREGWISDTQKGVKRNRESTTKPKKSEGEMITELRKRKTSLLYPSSFSLNFSTRHPATAPICIFPRTQRSYSESETVWPQISSDNLTSALTKPAFGSLCPAGSPRCSQLPRRRAWHSGSSHSADAPQRAFQLSGGVLPCEDGRENAAYMNVRPRSKEGVRRQVIDGVPVKRKAWISEGPETEQG